MNTCNVCVSDGVILKSCFVCKEKACKDCWSFHLSTILKSDCMFCKDYIPVKDIKDLCGKKTYKKICKGYWETFVSNVDENIKNKIEGENFITPKQYVIIERLGLLDDIYSKCKFKVEGVMSESSLTYNRKCSIINCIGILVNGKCIKCDREECIKCNKITSKFHVCKQEDIKAKKELDKITYRCPNCNIRFVSDGCNNNYCIACKTYFNRDTKKISKVKFHTGNTPKDDLKNLYSGDFSEIIDTLPINMNSTVLDILNSCRNIVTSEYCTTDKLAIKKNKDLHSIKVRFYKGRLKEDTAISKYIHTMFRHSGRSGNSGKSIIDYRCGNTKNRNRNRDLKRN